MKQLKLAVFDIDGTLLDKGAVQISDKTRDALTQLQANGMWTAIASGRHFAEIDLAIFRDITFDYYICSNGAQVLDAQGVIISQALIELDAIEHMIEDAKKVNATLIFKFEESPYCFHNGEDAKRLLYSFLGDTMKLINEETAPMRHYKSLPVSGILRLKGDALTQFKQTYDDYEFVEFERDGYDITTKGCHKASSIASLLDNLSITMEQVIAFGDSMNDFEMITQCGYGVAMGNALQELKDIAQYVTKKCNEDGVYEACKTLALI